MTTEKVLFVDDEPAVLEGYQRLLRKEFNLEVAPGGEQALEAIATRGPFAAVFSDMRMPGMNGIQFLTKVRACAPDTVHLMLTGHADLQSVMDAVNEGCVFRFLTKPCELQVLAKAVNAAMMQYRLLISEKELLEKTLHGSIQVLTEILSFTNPAAFACATRMRRYVQHVAAKLNLPSSWRYEIAAMLSQLGCVTLHPDTVNAIYAGEQLTPDEQANYENHPMVTWNLLSNIPRMQPIAWIIAQQNGLAKPLRPSEDGDLAGLEFGARLLRCVRAYDRLVNRGDSHHEAMKVLYAEADRSDHPILDAMQDMPSCEDNVQVRVCPINALTSGMILDADVKTDTGLLVVARGQEVSASLIARLRSFAQRGVIAERVRVRG